MDIDKYRYVGFGSFMFDDFKIIHHQLGISSMVSIENDNSTYERAKFNKPYSCIEVCNTTSTDFISDISMEEQSIFWLDYTSPSELALQLSDFCTLLNNMKRYDIIRITLNANPSSLSNDGHDTNSDGNPQNKEHKKRFDKLKNKIPDYIPSNSSIEGMSYSRYPMFLLSCLERAAYTVLKPSKFQKKILKPLFSSVYADGQQMVTLTAIVLNDNDERMNEIKDCLKAFEYANFKWDDPCKIQVPELTPKEIIHINSLLPQGEATLAHLKKDFGFAFCHTHCSNEMLESYVRYYKYYPNFHHVNL
jgi:hypothetical protein